MKTEKKKLETNKQSKQHYYIYIGEVSWMTSLSFRYMDGYLISQFEEEENKKEKPGSLI